MWAPRDVVPRPDDFPQDRLHCIRWVDKYAETHDEGNVREWELDGRLAGKLASLLGSEGV